MQYIAVDPRPSRARTVERFLAAIQANDSATLAEVLTPDAVTRWPQSREQVTGAMACLRIYQNYPGGPPVHRVERVVGDGDIWIAELVADYGSERWLIVSIFEFEGARIARTSDYFAQTLPAPDWRRKYVDRQEEA